MKLKVGDKVRVVRARNPEKEGAEAYIGQSGILKANDCGGNWPYHVNFPDEDWQVFSARELELIPKAKRRAGKK